MGELKLQEKFTSGGEELSVIQYDTSKIKGKTIINIVNRLGKKGLSVALPELDINVQLELFAKASGMPVIELERLGATDLLAACGEMRSFLLSSSDEQETETESEE